MIQFHMLTKSRDACEGIADLILEEKYAKDVRIEQLVQLEWDENQHQKIGREFHRVTCLMKATLFTPLVAHVTSLYGDEPRMFSLPVTQIEDDWAMEIRNTTKKA